MDLFGPLFEFVGERDVDVLALASAMIPSLQVLVAGSASNRLRHVREERKWSWQAGEVFSHYHRVVDRLESQLHRVVEPRGRARGRIPTRSRRTDPTSIPQPRPRRRMRCRRWSPIRCCGWRRRRPGLGPEVSTASRILENHRGQRCRGPFAERIPRVENVLEPVVPPTLVSLAEIRLEVVAPLVQHDLRVVFVGVGVFPAQDVERVVAAGEERVPINPRLDIAISRPIAWAPAPRSGT